MNLFQRYEFPGLTISSFENLRNMSVADCSENFDVAAIIKSLHHVLCRARPRSAEGSTYCGISTLSQLFQLLERAWMPLPIHGDEDRMYNDLVEAATSQVAGR